MNAVLPRFLKSAYRREPIVSILITMGVVDALIGGFDDSWSLFAVGLGTAGVALAFKLWRNSQQQPPLPEEPVVQHYLPPRSSNSTLPMLTVNKKKPPY
ncbi:MULTISPECIES: hypothetical protein [Nostocales]|uniref:hypothetical protein n=1 Tax=Nostocales TaxID=1161 RepID=UPI001F1FE709|nr:hypothetical protein [Nostoc sp. CMAA1605]MCF4967280.1 hypothetical protein [Nostoc sp. CMAA1605]